MHKVLRFNTLLLHTVPKPNANITTADFSTTNSNTVSMPAR